MNMKKSIAGVMAGAMAVSAMATTASAWTGGDADQAQIVLSYDLNKYTQDITDTTLTVRYTFADNTDGYVIENLKKGGADVDAVIGSSLQGGIYDLTALKVSATGFPQYDADGKQSSANSDTWSFVSEAAKDNLAAYASATNVITAGQTNYDANGNAVSFTIPFTSSKDAAKKISVGGFEKYATEGASMKVTGYTITYDKTTAAVNTALKLKKNTKTVADATTAIGEVAVLKNGATKIKETDKLNTALKKGTVVTTDTAIDIGEGATNYAPSYAADPTDSTGAKQIVTWYTVDTEAVVTAGKVEAITEEFNADGTPKATGATVKYEDRLAALKYEAAQNGALIANVKGVASTAFDDSTVYYAFKTFTVELTYSVYHDANWNETWVSVTTNSPINIIKASTLPVASRTAGNSGNYAEPLASSPVKPGNVIERLTVNGYTYPQAVLNDVIANNENVAFTFTTCQKYVDTREYIKVKAHHNIGKVNGTDTTRVRVSTPLGGTTTLDVATKSIIIRNVGEWNEKDSWYIANPFYGVAYDANKDYDFTGDKKYLWYNPYFTQDLYQTWTWKYLDGVDNHTAGKGYNNWGPNGSQDGKSLFGSYASQWNKNLLAAGLVVNSAWTMQLNQATAFEWGDQTITFFWDDITADANVTNAANFLTSLQLYTPTEWFWDKMDVSVGAAIAEDVASNAGLEEDVEEVVEEEEVIEEEPVVEEEPVEEEIEEDFGEEDFEEDFGEEDFEEEPEEEPEEEETVEETEPVEVESPKTGNAPIALAVIPVALAAAAVIAKKKN